MEARNHTNIEQKTLTVGKDAFADGKVALHLSSSCMSPAASARALVTDRSDCALLGPVEAWRRLLDGAWRVDALEVLAVLERRAHTAVTHEGLHLIIAQVAELVHAQLERNLHACTSSNCLT